MPRQLTTLWLSICWHKCVRLGQHKRPPNWKERRPSLKITFTRLVFEKKNFTAGAKRRVSYADRLRVCAAEPVTRVFMQIPFSRRFPHKHRIGSEDFWLGRALATDTSPGRDATVVTPSNLVQSVKIKRCARFLSLPYISSAISIQRAKENDVWGGGRREKSRQPSDVIEAMATALRFPGVRHRCGARSIRDSLWRHRSRRAPSLLSTAASSPSFLQPLFIFDERPSSCSCFFLFSSSLSLFFIVC